jgi:hypothetical protein
MIGISAIAVTNSHFEIRERQAEGIADTVIYVPISFAPTLIKQLQGLVTSEGEEA